MVLSRSEIAHRRFIDLPNLLKPGDRLIFNDTSVVKARLRAQKSTGGKVEIFVERVLGTDALLVKLRASKTPKIGSVLEIGGTTLTVTDRPGEHFVLQTTSDVEALLELHGEVPLPPYIHRQPNSIDASRYQTIYAAHPGAVAAPTAGLHFDETLMQALADHEITRSFVTLHVGAGTFQPVRTDKVADHVMHTERVVVAASTVDEIKQTQAAGGRIIAVGTTAVRSLETASRGGELQPYAGETQLFLTPGDKFLVVDGMITNFHLSESTLLMLVCAFAGTENTLKAYRSAVESRYRFFSYGDSMLVWPQVGVRS